LTAEQSWFTGAGTLVVIAPLSALQNATVMGDLMGGWPFEPALPIALAMAADAEVDVHGETTSSYVIGCGSVTKIVLVPLPDTASRSYSPTHSLAVTGGLLKAGLSETAGTAVVLAALASADHAGATACGVARALPLYSRKQTSSTKCLAACAVAFSTVVAPLELLAPSIGVSAAVAAVRNAARLTDTPCAELNAEQFEDAIRSRLADLPGVTIYSIVGVSELREHGLGGIAAVGQAALCPPRLVVMMLTPSDSEAALAPPIGLVGKGIVFDTGGLNLKANGGRGMKDDCAGAAAALGAFELLARLAEAGDPAAIQAPVVAALCIAENALGAASYRPDDIVQMHSGKTVEVVDTGALLVVSRPYFCLL
jgi:probable aminopeptidase NPEPL1